MTMSIVRGVQVTLWICGLLLFTDLPAAAQQPASERSSASQQERGKSDRYEVRLYDVSFLRERDSELVADWLGEAAGSGAKTNNARGSGAEVFGGMGGMGGGMGGGGFFHVPDHIQPQMRGGGMGGMGGMGMAEIPADTGPRVGSKLHAVMQLILSSVDHGNWEIYGGDAAMQLIGNQLAIYQTPAAHEQIEALFEQLRSRLASQKSVEVDVRLVTITSDEAKALPDERSATWDELAARDQAVHLSVRCRDGQRASIAAGVRRSYVVKTVPVVGDADQRSGRAIGYSPVVITPLIGVYGEILPQVVQRAEGDASAYKAEIDLGLILANAPGEVGTVVYGSGETIDRLELQTAELETSVMAVQEQWILAGVAALADSTSGITSGEVLPHLAVLVKWSLVRE